MKYRWVFVLSFLVAHLHVANTQTEITVNPHVLHCIDTFCSFDRSVFINIHADQVEQEWQGNNASDDLLSDFINGLNVYMGRNTGGISWYLNQVPEDPGRPGFADTVQLQSWGAWSKQQYDQRTMLHPYEPRNDLIVAGQLNPFWTGINQKPTGQGWKLANAMATGEYMANYLRYFHGQEGPPMPSYIEVINEPAYENFGGPEDFQNDLSSIADFHVEVASSIREKHPNAKIGGYTTAFPNFEKGDFLRWKNRWKVFVDRAGHSMDFWSIHLYDFPTIDGGQRRMRSGSNVEATFDLLDHYTTLQLGSPKSYIISEYGAQMHDFFGQQWSPYRDWFHISSSNGLLMSFLERPHLIEKAINFLVVKGEWGYQNGIPYLHRLMRKENEPDAYTGEWVYTDMVKFFELWSEVSGERVDIISSSKDILAKAYVDSNQLFVIVHNLQTDSEVLDLNVDDTQNGSWIRADVRHLTLVDNQPEIEEFQLLSTDDGFALGPESTAIIKYSFDDKIFETASIMEKKYYATSYLSPIVANEPIDFHFDQIEMNEYGECILRLGVGRSHGKKLTPTIRINGNLLTSPVEWKGGDQLQRERFFGVLEWTVPFDWLSEYNEVQVTFSDMGGHVSSACLQVFNFSEDIRSGNSNTTELLPDKINRPMLIPNPAKDYIEFDLDRSLYDDVYQIIDPLGHIAFLGKLSETGNKIDLSTWKGGIYFFCIKSATGEQISIPFFLLKQ